MFEKKVCHREACIQGRTVGAALPAASCHGCDPPVAEVYRADRRADLAIADLGGSHRDVEHVALDREGSWLVKGLNPL